METNNTAEAGFWTRVCATIIDTVLLATITIPPLIGIYGFEYFHSPNLVVGFWDFWIGWILPAVIVVAFWTRKSATPGKMITKIKVVDAKTGSRLTLGQSIGRYLAYFVSALPMLIGLLWVAFDEKKQGWHDKIAKTKVIKV